MIRSADAVLACRQLQLTSELILVSSKAEAGEQMLSVAVQAAGCQRMVPKQATGLADAVSAALQSFDCSALRTAEEQYQPACKRWLVYSCRHSMEDTCECTCIAAAREMLALIMTMSMMTAESRLP